MTYNAYYAILTSGFVIDAFVRAVVPDFPSFPSCSGEITGESPKRKVSSTLSVWAPKFPEKSLFLQLSIIDTEIWKRGPSNVRRQKLS